MQSIYRKVVRFLIPACHAWGVIFCLFGFVKFTYFSLGLRIPPALLFIILGIPALALELIMSKYYDGLNARSLKGAALLAARMFFWTCIALFIINSPDKDRSRFIYFPKFFFFGPYIYAKYSSAVYLISLFLILLYYRYVIGKRALRLTITIILPVVLIAYAFISFHYIIECTNLEEINSQKDVKVVFELKKIIGWVEQHGAPNPVSAVKWASPKQLCVEDNTAYAAYGFLNSPLMDTPSFFKLDIAAVKVINCIFEQPVKTMAIERDNEKAYLGIWSPGRIKIIDKYNFKKLSDIILPKELGHFALQDFCLDPKRDILYIGLLYAQKVIKYDLASRTVIGILDLKKSGPVKQGCAFQDALKIIHLPLKNKLFILIVADPGCYLAEVDDEDFTIKKSIKLPGYANIMGLDEAKNTIFLPGYAVNRMWEVDTQCLKIVKTYKNTPLGCRHIYVDPEGDKVFLLSHSLGKLFAFSRRSGKIEREYLVGDKPDGLCVSDGYLYISSAAGIVRVKI